MLGLDLTHERRLDLTHERLSRAWTATKASTPGNPDLIASTDFGLWPVTMTVAPSP